MRLNRTRKSFFALILTLSFAPFFCRAQDFHGNLIGTVKDSSGARIPSAAIILPASESSVERRAKSDHRGAFGFSDLTPATYRMSVQAPGFADASSIVTVSVSSARDITVTMHPAPSRQQVSVA